MSTVRLSLYREAMELESKRASLQSDLERVSARLTQIQNVLFSGEEPVTLSKSPGAPIFLGTPRKQKGRAGRGELRAQVLQVLQNAGTAGVAVQEIAKAVRSKPANIHAWFQNAAKKISQIKKVGRGLYRLEGTATFKAEAGKTTKAAKGSKRGKRGALAVQIETLLKEAGNAGMTVRDIGAQTGVKYRNLSVWFSTTGKKNKALKKIAPGHYRLA